VFTYFIFFITLYTQVFLLITFLEKDGVFVEEEEKEQEEKGEPYSPIVTIVIPVWNEEKTLAGTIDSVLALKYPKSKLDVVIIDDGSTDKTFKIAKKFSHYPFIRVFHKENGGKHTAVNFGISIAKGELIGCLDADSYVHPDAVTEIVKVFRDKKIMAVTPAIRVHAPQNALQRVQVIEYELCIFFRKMLGKMNAQNIAPGSFSFFRKKVFDDLGGYKKAHNTEDMELSMRMHQHHYPIANAPKAFVETVTPRTLKGLYIQRLRWAYGYVVNMIDYRKMIFNRKYGNVGMFTLPTGALSALAAIFLTLLGIYELGKRVFEKTLEINTVGIHFYPIQFTAFDWFFFNTNFLAVITFFITMATVIAVFVGRKLSNNNTKLGMNVVFFFLFYGIFSSVCLLKAAYNVVMGKRVTWR